MHASDNDDDIRVHAVVNAVWKSAEQPAPGIALNHGGEARIVHNGSKCMVNSFEEFDAEAGPLLLIPGNRILDVRRRGRTDDCMHQARRSRSRL